MGMSSDPPLMMQLEAWHASVRVTLDGLPPVEGCVVPVSRGGCWECPSLVPIVFIPFAD